MRPPERRQTIEPRMRSRDHPSPCAIPRNAPTFDLFFSTRLDVSGVAPFRHGFACVLVVVSLVRAEVLLLTQHGLRSLDGQAVQRGGRQSHVVRVGSADGQRQRNAGAIGKQASLASRFGPIRGVGTGISPPEGGFGHGAVDTLPVPLIALQFVLLHQSAHSQRNPPFAASSPRDPT